MTIYQVVRVSTLFISELMLTERRGYLAISRVSRSPAAIWLVGSDATNRRSFRSE